MEFSSNDKFLITISINNLDNFFNINNKNDFNKKASDIFKKENFEEYSNLMSNVIIFDWENENILFTYCLNSKIIEMNFCDLTFNKIEDIDNENKLIFEKNMITFKNYEENFYNFFLLAEKRNIFFIFLRKSTVEIKDLKLQSIIFSDISSCKIMNLLEKKITLIFIQDMLMEVLYCGKYILKKKIKVKDSIKY